MQCSRQGFVRTRPCQTELRPEAPHTLPRNPKRRTAKNKQCNRQSSTWEARPASSTMMEPTRFMLTLLCKLTWVRVSGKQEKHHMISKRVLHMQRLFRR